MLFQSSTAHRSCDDPQVPWKAIRDAPATHPRVTMLRLVSEHFEWAFTVAEASKGRGVTCGDVIETISQELHRLISREDYHRLPPAEQFKVTSVYRHNRSGGAEDPSLGEGIKRVDFLKEDVNFAGVEVNDSVISALTGENIPCTFVLRREPSPGPVPSPPDERLIEH